MERREGSRGLVLETLLALAAPKRLVPFAGVALPLLAAELFYTWSARAVLLGAALCLAFWLIAPATWRWLCPTLVPTSPARRALGTAIFVLVCAGVVTAIGGLLPYWLRLFRGFLFDEVTLMVMIGMFAVGGWGLGRDIDLELGLVRERRRAELLAEEAERAELLALRAHLDPHFLFNTLNAIAELCQQDPAAAERATLKLASMLRAVLAGVRRETWPLGEELELVRELLALHEIRDPERFGSEVRVPEPVPAVDLPPMILLPLVENAMKHGPGAGHRGRVRVEVEGGAGGVTLRVLSPGPFGGRRPGGEGIAMVERRLALAYGDAAALEIGSAGDETEARIDISGAARPRPDREDG